MKQGYIQVKNIQLYYVEYNEGKNETLFFIHGNCVSSNCWIHQLKSSVLKDYRLVAIDLPAHGRSWISRDPDCDYTLTGLAGIVAQAVDQLIEGPYVLCGLSLGTNIIAESIPFIKKPQAIVLSGPCIIGQQYPVNNFLKPATHTHVLFAERASEQDVGSYAKEVMFGPDEEVTKSFINGYYTTSGIFRSVFAKALNDQKYNDEVELLKQYGSPILLIFGKDEKILYPEYLDNSGLNLWNNCVYKIPDAGHFVNIDQPQAFNQLLADYAIAMFDTQV